MNTLSPNQTCLLSLFTAGLLLACSGDDDSSSDFSDGESALEEGQADESSDVRPAEQPGGGSSPEVGECTVVCGATCYEWRGIPITCAEPFGDGTCEANNAICERQADGECGFTQTDASMTCSGSDVQGVSDFKEDDAVDSGVAPVEPPSGESLPEKGECTVVCGATCYEWNGYAIECAEPFGELTCEAQTAICERQGDGRCGFTQTDASMACSN